MASAATASTPFLLQQRRQAAAERHATKTKEPLWDDEANYSSQRCNALTNGGRTVERSVVCEKVR